jgi:hypothetical protein
MWLKKEMMTLSFVYIWFGGFFLCVWTEWINEENSKIHTLSDAWILILEYLIRTLMGLWKTEWLRRQTKQGVEISTRENETLFPNRLRFILAIKQQQQKTSNVCMEYHIIRFTVISPGQNYLEWSLNKRWKNTMYDRRCNQNWWAQQWFRRGWSATDSL